MKRYGWSMPDNDYIERDNGRFVEWEDHLSNVQALQARIVELEESSLWIAVTDRLPENASPVLIYGVNSAGKGRRLRAMYAREFDLEAFEDDDTADYSEEKDEYFAKPGWYENNEFEEVHWLIDFPVTHWQPLPKEPTK